MQSKVTNATGGICRGYTRIQTEKINIDEGPTDVSDAKLDGWWGEIASCKWGVYA